MKNVIVFVCDGLSYDMTIDKPQHPSPMKFLNELKKKGTSCSNAYSQAPYTEGGMMGLMYGRNPLDNGAYTLGMQEWKNSLYELLYNKGYDIFSSYYGSSTPPELMTKGYYMYAQNYFNPMFSRYINGKLDYYKTVKDKEGALSSDDYIVLKRLLYRHFDSMILWHSELAEQHDQTGNYQPCIVETQERKERIQEWRREAIKQYNMFKEDEVSYIDSIFKEYDDHFIIKDCNVEGLPYCDELIEQKGYVKERYKDLFCKIKRLNAEYFIKNRQVPFRQLTYTALHNRKKFPEYIYRTIQACSKFDIEKMTSPDLKQLVLSARAYIRGFFDWLDLRSTAESPFFLYLHCDEFHRPLSFYSHDIRDRELIDSELSSAKEYVANLPRDYKGNIGFDLSAQYLDMCIKELYESLYARNLLDNTILMITADHGSSNFGEHVRYTVTNNFYDEQYHIPLIILGDKSNCVLQNYVNIKDIPYTILELCKFEIPQTFTGKSIYENIDDFTFVEYLGTGVPDLQRRPIQYLYRSKTEAYLIEAKIAESYSCAHVTEYYDLKRDPYQFNNIVKKIDRSIVDRCLSGYEMRFNELSQNYKDWLENGDG